MDNMLICKKVWKYSELTQTSKIKPFAIVNGYKLLTTSAKISILDVLLCSKYASREVCPNGSSLWFSWPFNDQNAPLI